jgi:hypothetical protein
MVGSFQFLESLEDRVKKLRDRCDLALAEVSREPSVETGEDWPRGDGFGEPLRRREEVRCSAVVVRGLPPDQASFFHTTDEDGDGGFVDPERLAHLLRQSARGSFENKQHTELRRAYAERLAKRGIRALQKAMLRQRH